MKSPRAIIRPGNEAEVVQVVNFCRTKGVHLIVKNGGHSYAAHCLSEGGIVMYIDKLNKVSINKDSTEVTIAAGAIWKHVYDQFVGRNKANIVVGGQCPYVGVSGFTMGGGLSPFSRSYGLGIDNVLAIKVVTAEGDIKTIRKESDWRGLTTVQKNLQRLLWGICGGGGGNFGVLLEFTSKVHSLNDTGGKVVCGQLTWNLKDPESRARFESALAAFNAMECPEALTIDGLWRANGDELTGYLTVLYNGSMIACKEHLQELINLSDKDGLEEMIWSDWVHKEDGWGLKSGIFHRHISFILGQGAITPAFVNQVYGLMKRAQTMFPKAHFLWGHIGGKTAEHATDATPFPWREGMYVCNLKVAWRDPSHQVAADEFLNAAWLDLKVHALEQKAAYLNYIDPQLPNWQQSYYGTNYPQLQQIKRLWDPQDFFRFNQAIELPPDPVNPQQQEIAPIPGIPPNVEIGLDLGITTAKLRPDWTRYAIPNPQDFQNLANMDEDDIYRMMRDTRMKKV
ncbi:FAD-binding domain protein [Rhizoctonia solani AG-3 Rhs1AP]|uniref:FAD-binding domain protein n=2 Tax=Rhizoctonia solani AG-3 TaxID=1086053 RepID=A0A074RFG7_9AGAM|nr:FAD-binding domain protein [Rhizoctonia solani AG-3 Rhs1AP]KEP45524.1 FAD-binding domain protein [Rhizoctonia solani 123E]